MQKKYQYVYTVYKITHLVKKTDTKKFVTLVIFNFCWYITHITVFKRFHT